MQQSLLLVGALGLLTLGACGSQPRVYSGFIATAYSPSEFGRGAGRKDLWVQVRGDPFGLGQEAFDAVVLAALRRHQPRPQPTHFTLDPGESANLAYRMVLLFDAPPAIAIGACRSEIPTADTPPDVVRVSAMFCRDRGTLTNVTGEIREIGSVDDPAFDALMGQIVAELFPLRDPKRDDDDGPVILVR